MRPTLLLAFLSSLCLLHTPLATGRQIHVRGRGHGHGHGRHGHLHRGTRRIDDHDQDHDHVSKDVQRVRHAFDDILSMLESMLLGGGSGSRSRTTTDHLALHGPSAPQGPVPATTAARTASFHSQQTKNSKRTSTTHSTSRPLRVTKTAPSAARVTIKTTITITRTITVWSTYGTLTSTTLRAGGSGSSVLSSTEALTLSPSLVSPTTLQIFSLQTGTITLQTPTATPTPQPLFFNSQSRSNIAVYYGQAPGTTADGLLEICANPFVSIVNLAFVSVYFGPGGFPTTSFGPACQGPSEAQSEVASGLQDCTYLGQQIKACQSEYGKVVMVSLGGYIAQSAFSSSAQATEFATTIWNLFGGGTDYAELRPFGSDVVVDGFDIDNENHDTLFYEDFVSGLRDNFATDTSGRIFYIGAAPQCPRPDASIPESVLRAADFVWVQFYNNPSCNLDSSGFLDSFNTWSQDLLNSSLTTSSTGPRLFVGMPAWPGGGTGYVDVGDLANVMAGVKLLSVPNFGGVMLWDGTNALLNKDEDDRSYLEIVAEALQ